MYLGTITLATYEMTILHLCVSLLVIQSAFGSTMEDAEKALQELDDLSFYVQGELSESMYNQSVLLRDNVHEMEVSATQEIQNQIATVTSIIKTLFDNVESVIEDVVSCEIGPDQELKTYGEELKKQLKECGDHLIMTGTAMMYSTWHKILLDYDFHYNCNKMSLWECKTYENEKCVDSVLENIERAKVDMTNSAKVITAEMLNRVIGMNYSCGDMVVQDMKHYSSVILKFVSSCLKNLGDVAFKPIC